MSQTIPLLTLQANPVIGLRYVQEALIAAGMELQQSFDLQVARAAHTGCSCSYHGTEGCTCQMVVLLVYREDPTPITLVVHGKEAVTHIALVGAPGSRPDEAFIASIQETLNEWARTPHSGQDWAQET